MELNQKVEKIRAKLVKMGMEKGLRDPQVIKLSRTLDQLIKEAYQKGPGFDAGRSKAHNLQ